MAVNRPLWQILFALSFAALAVQRAVVGYTLEEAAPHPALALTWVLVIAAAAATALGALIERTWAVGAVAATGALLVASALLQVPFAGHPLAAALAEVGIVALLGVALAAALRHGERHPANEGEQRDPPRDEKRSTPRT